MVRQFHYFRKFWLNIKMGTIIPTVSDNIYFFNNKERTNAHDEEQWPWRPRLSVCMTPCRFTSSGSSKAVADWYFSLFPFPLALSLSFTFFFSLSLSPFFFSLVLWMERDMCELVLSFYVIFVGTLDVPSAMYISMSSTQVKSNVPNLWCGPVLLRRPADVCKKIWVERSFVERLKLIYRDINVAIMYALRWFRFIAVFREVFWVL